MSETSIRELLRDAMAASEPPIRSHLVSSAVRAARRARRLRLAAALSATAVAVPALAFGVPALAGALSHVAVGHHARAIGPNSGQSGSQAATTGQSAAPANQFMQPTLPAAYPDPDPVPITDQSLGQLLIDDMPAGAQLSQIEASLDPNPNGAPMSFRAVYAGFNIVTTPIGAGLVHATMSEAGSSPLDFGCQGASAADCQVYTLPGGVEVQEDYMGGLLFVGVFRPNVAMVDISEANTAAAAGSPATNGVPLTLAQMLSAALDPRWQFTISASFAQQASGLHVVPYV